MFGALSSLYWSSTSIAVVPDVAWLVDFGYGDVVYGFVVKGLVNYVRAVRNAP